MSSAAYAEWELYKRDAELLEALGAAHGALGSLLPPGSAAGEAEQAARRASVIAVAAAYERYVINLFCDVARALGGQCAQVGRALAWTPTGRTHPLRIALRTPAPREVRQLFARAVPGEDIWSGITTRLSPTCGSVLMFVGDHLLMRHEFAHGANRGPVSDALIRDRIENFGAIVRALDRGGSRLVRIATGATPW